MPLSPQLDLIGWIGCGGEDYTLKQPASGASARSEFGSVDLGAAVQSMVDPKDGVRSDDARFVADSRYEPDSDVLSLSYVRRF